MKIKLFADGSNRDLIAQQAQLDLITGFTTNPSLMRAAGVQRYRAGAEMILKAARRKPVSIEVLSDNAKDMQREALGIAALAKNAVVKVPVVNSQGEFMGALISNLSEIPLNVTAVFTVEQVRMVGEALGKSGAPAIVSVFAGRIADAGTDPFQHVAECRKVLRKVCPRAEMLWASSRQAYDVYLAERAGCEIITLTADLLAKVSLFGKDLNEYSRETSAQFHRDAQASGYVL